MKKLNKETILGMFRADKGTISSKRVCGVEIVQVLCIGYLYSCFMNTPMPDGTDIMMLGALCLLGVDSVTEIWKLRGKAVSAIGSALPDNTPPDNTSPDNTSPDNTSPDSPPVRRVDLSAESSAESPAESSIDDYPDPTESVPK